mmetsp:Transcript_14181/g.26584  ORF Transcript_14181/g.26584 Transcript_14181/m.26584 type:complete len:368 (+) Transcript_14181:218-1321(+)
MPQAASAALLKDAFVAGEHGGLLDGLKGVADQPDRRVGICIHLGDAAGKGAVGLLRLDEQSPEGARHVIVAVQDDAGVRRLPQKLVRLCGWVWYHGLGFQRPRQVIHVVVESLQRVSCGHELSSQLIFLSHLALRVKFKSLCHIYIHLCLEEDLLKGLAGTLLLVHLLHGFSKVGLHSICRLRGIPGNAAMLDGILPELVDALLLLLIGCLQSSKTHISGKLHVHELRDLLLHLLLELGVKAILLCQVCLHLRQLLCFRPPGLLGLVLSRHELSHLALLCFQHLLLAVQLRQHLLCLLALVLGFQLFLLCHFSECGHVCLHPLSLFEGVLGVPQRPPEGLADEGGDHPRLLLFAPQSLAKPHGGGCS